MTEWAHLPNVVQIKRILTDVKVRPGAWTTLPRTSSGAAVSAARAVGPAKPLGEIHDMAGAMASAGIRVQAPDGEWLSIYTAVRTALYALIAWDSSADLLALTPDALRTIIDTCDGDVKHQAVLLLPAVIALSTP